MNFKYVAYTSQNKIVKGTLGVPSRSVAVETLEQSGLKVVSLKKAKRWDTSRFLQSSSIKARDVILFSRQLAMLLESGAGFLTSLQLSRDQTSNKALKTILDGVIEDVRSGSTFSSAIAKYPKAFPLAYTRMMKLGEQAGNMETVLRELATNIEKDEAAKKKVKGALTYPIFLLILGVITAIIMMTAVLPSITNLFTEFDTELPWTTRTVMAVGDFFTYAKYYLIGGILLIALFTMWYIKRPSGRYRLEKIILRLPVIGRISLFHNMRGFSRSMATLLKAGLPMKDVMTVVQQSAPSEVMRQTLSRIPHHLLQGKSLSQAMRTEQIFPAMLVQMVTTGEETNTLDSSFAAIADHYESEFDDTLASFISTLEPVMLLFIGLVIGFIAVAVIMPIYSLNSVID